MKLLSFSSVCTLFHAFSYTHLTYSSDKDLCELLAAIVQREQSMHIAWLNNIGTLMHGVDKMKDLTARISGERVYSSAMKIAGESINMHTASQTVEDTPPFEEVGP
jgi:hypothetical protein